MRIKYGLNIKERVSEDSIDGSKRLKCSDSKDIGKCSCWQLVMSGGCSETAFVVGCKRTVSGDRSLSEKLPTSAK